MAGVQSDVVAALVFCNPGCVDWSVINGGVVVKDGVLQTADLKVSVL